MVCGHTSATAPANPEPPSVTTISGGAILESSADHAAFVSALAICQESTCPSLRAMRTTRSLARYMPSTKTTLWTSSTHSGMGHILQNLPVRRLKSLPPPGIERMVSLPSRHPRKASSSALSVLYLTTDEPPHDVHLHLCLPALANPFFLSLARRRRSGILPPAVLPGRSSVGLQRVAVLRSHEAHRGRGRGRCRRSWPCSLVGSARRGVVKAAAAGIKKTELFPQNGGFQPPFAAIRLHGVRPRSRSTMGHSSATAKHLLRGLRFWSPPGGPERPLEVVRC